MRRSLVRAHNKGIALLLVIAVIVALVIIATPFALSMRMHERSSLRYDASGRARHIAKAGRGLAINQLINSHSSIESQDNANDHEFDGLGEFILDNGAIQGLSSLTQNDAQGEMYKVDIADELGKLDINTASPYALAGLLGATMLTEDLEYTEDRRIVVESTRDFYSDGDPDTVDGCLYIVRRNGTEKIWYVDKTPTEFIIAKNGRRKYLSNAIQNTDPSSINEESKQKRRFDAGCPVYDARAFKVQNHAIWRTVLRPSQDGIEDPMNYELDDFDTTSSIRKISNWNFGLYLTYSQLLGQGLTFYDIQSMGLTEDLKDLGVDARRLRAREETEEEKAASEAAREELKKMDLSAADLAGLKGRNIAGIAKRLAKVKKSKNGQAKYDKLLADTKRRAQIARGRDAWFKREIPKTIRALAAVNNESSDFEALGPIKFEDIRPYITATTTSLYGKWTDPVVNFNRIEFNPESSVTSFRVQDTRFVVRGAIAKIVHGGKTHYRRVVRSNRNVISVFPRMEATIETRTATISCRMPTPVNINTASRRVLFAIFQSLAVRTKTGTSSVTPAEAGKLADAILARDPEAPFKNHIEFAQFLAEQVSAGVIDTTDSLSILINAINPADNRLLRHTVPFIYRSGDIYTVESTGIVNDAGRNELSRYSVREIIQVAPPEPLEFAVSSQFDFEAQLRVGPFTALLPQKYKNLLRSFPTNVLQGGLPDNTRGQAHIQLQTAEVSPERLAGTRGFVEHFRGGPEIAVRLPRNVAGNQQPQKQINPNPGAGALTSNLINVLGDGTYSAWIRFDSPQGEKAVFMDYGREELANRMVCYFDAATQEIVYQLYDETLDLRESAALGLPERRAIEVRGPKQLRRGNWYHVGMSWRGAENKSLAAFVDGEFVTLQEKYVTKLRTSIDSRAVIIPVEDTTGFPDRGVIRVGGYFDANGRLVGGELINYDVKSGNSFTARTVQQELTRFGYKAVGTATYDFRYAARGSGNPRSRLQIQGYRGFNQADQTRQKQFTFINGGSFGTGTPVYIYGYTCGVDLNFTPAVPATATTPGRPARTRFQTLRRGNASLVGALPERTPITLLYKDFDILSANQPPPPPQPSPRLPVPPAPNPRTDMALGDQDLILQTLPIDTTNIPQQGILFIEGDNAYAADGFPPDTPGEATVMNPEFVAYSSHRLVNGFLQFNLSARGLFGTTQRKHAIFSAVVLVSINFTNDLSDYGLQALTATGDQTAANQLGSNQGTLTALTADENNYEWIKLFRSDEAAFRNYGILAGLMRNQGEATFLGPRNRIFTGAFRPRRRRLYLNPFKSNPGRKATLAAAILQDENWSFLTPLVDGYAGLGVGAGDGKLTGAELNALPGMVWDANGQRVAATMNIAQWLNRIEPCERGRAQEETGIGNSQGPGRGPGIAHVNGTELLPIVIMERNGQTNRNGNLFADRFDVVTVTDNADPPIREELMVVHARPVQRGDRVRVSLDGFVSRTITGLSGGRFAKFPTGRMPRHGRPMSIGAPTPKIAVSQSVTGGNSGGNNGGTNGGGNNGNGNNGNGAPPNPYGPIGGYIDEIKMTFDQTRVSTLRELLPVGTQTLQQRPVNPFPRASRRGNTQPFLAKVGNEIIAFTDPDNLTMTRGMLKSAAEAHGTDEPVWILPFPEIAVASGGFSQPFNNSVAVQRNSHRAFLPRNSYFAIDAGTGQGFQTVIAYSQRRGGSFNFAVDRNGNGVFRNCFGSTARQPASGDVLVNLPVRFHDHYQVNKTSLEGTYYQFSKTIPGAFIESIDWEVEHPNAYTQLVVRVRIDGKDTWEGRDTAKNGKRGVLVFHDPPLVRTARGQTRRTNWIKRNGDQIDIQVWLTFKNGAFFRDCWKQTPSLKNIKVKYWQQTRVRYHEEKQE